MWVCSVDTKDSPRLPSQALCHKGADEGGDDALPWVWAALAGWYQPNFWEMDLEAVISPSFYELIRPVWVCQRYGLAMF